MTGVLLLLLLAGTNVGVFMLWREVRRAAVAFEAEPQRLTVEHVTKHRPDPDRPRERRPTLPEGL